MILTVWPPLALVNTCPRLPRFVLQIAFSFNKFLMYDETRVALLNYTQVVFYLIDLLQVIN